jgi:hypothetical protein
MDVNCRVSVKELEFKEKEVNERGESFRINRLSGVLLRDLRRTLVFGLVSYDPGKELPSPFFYRSK